MLLFVVCQVDLRLPVGYFGRKVTTVRCDDATREISLLLPCCLEVSLDWSPQLH